MNICKINSNKFILFFVIAVNAIIPLIVWPFGNDYFYLPKIIILSVLTVLLLCFILLNKPFKLSFSKDFLALYFYLTFVLLSAIFSKYKAQAFLGAHLRYEGALTLIIYSLILYFSYKTSSEKDNIKYILISLLISSCLIGIYSLIQYFGLDFIPRDAFRQEWIYHSFATLGNPNFLGSHLSMTFMISLCLFLSCKKSKTSCLLFFVTLILYSALICSRTRSAWVSTALTSLLFCILFFKNIIKNYKKIIVLLIACILITYSLNSVHDGFISDRFLSFLNDYKRITVDKDEIMRVGSQRIFIWTRTFEYIFDKPLLGNGPDTFNKVFFMTPDEAKYYFGSPLIYVDKAHNEYLQIAVTMGFPALFAYLWFLALIIYKSFKALKRHKNIYLVCLLSAVISYLIQAFFNISVVSVAPVFWSVLGLLMASYKKAGVR
ncbi:O-antigen ligase [Oxobacter pfennigii]|uniref:O-antigen ligase n=1 Tax=Oxobacter pfennigii TaxID=36849 RepID=A0A0P8WAH1_9CLOT|nr:O-antigen ligase family protein [Oxobacter pfennigii]KPU44958.1 O-antigen ligase [Oxobacter pfennigii]